MAKSSEEDNLQIFSTEKRRVFPKGIVWGIVGLVSLFVVSFGYFFYTTTANRASKSVADNIGKFQKGIDDLRNFNPRSAEKNFSAANNDLNSTFGGFVSGLGPLFRSSGELIAGFQKISSMGIRLSGEVAFFENDFLNSFISGRGADVIAHLESAKNILDQLVRETDKISSSNSFLEQVSPGSVKDIYFPLKLSIGQFQKFLDVLIPMANADTSRHVVLLFQNPSEIRPAGGFLGSYADITVKKAGLENTDVHDINDVDRQLDLKIIPPIPLQAVVTRLRAADANWFFDFKKSAEMVIKLLETSKLYSLQGVSFDGAIAISPKVIRDILLVIGPIDLPGARITLTSDNFLEEIQKQVQVGQVERVTYPKNILKELSSIILQKIELLDAKQKNELFLVARDWVQKKDIIIYSKNHDLQVFLENFGVAGTLYAPAANFEGDYLAVVDANVGGGKSDIFIKQDVLFTSQINASGTVTDHLTIKRSHEGARSKHWWYKTPNEDYLQIFIPTGSQLVNFSGGTAKAVYPAMNYAKNNYIDDPLVAEINSSTEKIFNYPAVLRHAESGKEVWSTWLKIKSGGKTEITFDYSHRLFLAPSDGSEYQFIFEKQAGTSRHYKFEINAPVGFRFRENNLPVYEYESDDPPGRLVVNLTLENIL